MAKRGIALVIACLSASCAPAMYSHGLAVGVGLDAYSRSAEPEAPQPVGPRDLARGRDLYRKNCSDCHGAAGLGNGPSGTGMDPRPANLVQSGGRYTERELFGLVANGRRDMPSWRDELSDDEIRWIVAYVHSLAAAKAEE